MSIRSRFSDAELTAIRDAAAAAERGSSAEVVAVIVDRCDAYDDALWKATAVGAVGAALVASTWHAAAALWGGWPLLWIAGPTLAGAALAASLAAIAPPLRRALTGRNTLTRRVRRRAALAFLEEGVTRTRDRTGVLLLVALFERRVEIIADEGLRGRVAPEAWEAVARELAEALRRGRPGPAVTDAIVRCGRILADAGVGAGEGDANELPDDVRLRDA